MNSQVKVISLEEDNVEGNETYNEKTKLIYKVLLVLGMMSIIGSLLTGVMTYMNVGYSDTFMTNWRNALFTAYAVMPIGFVLMGLFTKLINQLLPNTGVHTRNLIVGGLMALIMESLLAFSTAVNVIGFTNHSDLFTGWLEGFLAALPLGLTLMIITSMTIKPKIERFLKS